MRERQAKETRERVLESARQLFLEQGYPATTLGEVAARAGVAQPTLGRIFGNKRTLLDAVLRSAVRGPEAPSMTDQLEYVLAAPDAQRIVERQARLCRVAGERAAELFEILRSAALADPALEERRRAGAADRRRDQLRIARELRRRGGLKPGLSLEAAADVLWLYSSSEVYRLLVVERGWSPRRFEAWLRRTLRDALVGA